MQVTLIRRKPPPVSWWKLNSDGSVDNSTGRVGAGGLIRDLDGRWMKGFSRLLGRVDRLMAEAWALWDGLKTAIDMEIDKLMIELDCKVFLDLVWGGSDLNLKLKPIILNCRRMCRAFKEVRATHIFREADQAADLLAKEAREAGAAVLGCRILTDPPEELRSILISDYMGLFTHRTVHRVPYGPNSV